MLRKGFTLIELLIVITIIAILAGAAVPYVQDYIEDARLAKARADLGELRNAIIRYETETGALFTPTNINDWQKDLVGPYLQQALTDPWGSPYYLSNSGSIVFSAAEDRNINTNIIALDFRPALTPTRAFWIDVDKNGSVNNGDNIDIKFTRPLATGGAFTTLTNYDFDPGTIAGTVTTHPTKGSNWMRIVVGAVGAGSVVAGRDDITVATPIVDTAALNDVGFSPVPSPNQCRQIPVILKAAQ